MVNYLSTSSFTRVFIALFMVAISHAGAQFTTESLTIDVIAPESPAWMAELAAADDFKEPAESTAVPSRPYADLAAASINDLPPNQSLRRPGHQPAGALSGKVIFTMAGHGWTYDGDRMIYYTQRGLSHGMVEDMGNADQMHIFAHLLYNTGATVVPLKPIDHQPNERIIDNEMHQAEFFGNWRAGSSDRYFGDAETSVPYAVAPASLLETAVARYRPYIPQEGYYPVYVWARDGADRSNQLYRVRHSGGITEVRVNWRQVGKAWVWLGTYHFNEGDRGYVDISNQVIDPYEAYGNNVVVADAVRFGNGMGDVPRPAGVSGFTREDEGDSYWIERSLGVGADRRLFDIGRDSNSTVSSPPKAAAHINRENFGSYLDRVLISFHSNAATGKARGTVALFNASPRQRPTFQEGLAEIIGQELNSQMRQEPVPAGQEWTDRQRNTYSGINFGELRRDYIQNEMAATIVESAFHDNAEDVTFLLDPASRISMAEATLRGMLMWKAGIKNPNSANVMPPDAPAAIAATQRDGKIQVKWSPGEVGRYNGGPAASVRVYRSANGYGFDGGQQFSATAENITIDPLTTSGVTFLRVTTLNAAGESFPSQTIAVCPTRERTGRAPASAQTLLLAANTVLDRTTNIPYALGTQPGGGPYRPTAQTERVRAIYAMMEPAGAAEALALAATGVGFDGADTAAYEADLLGNNTYTHIFVAAEQQLPPSPILSQDVLSKLRTFVSRNGKLCLTGSGLTENLANSGKAGSDFLTGICGITEVNLAGSGKTLASQDNRFYSTTATLKLLSQNRSWASDKAVETAEFQINKNRSIGLLRYPAPDPTGFAAALTRPTPSEGEVITVGFPLSLIESQTDRNALMAAVLKQLQ